MASLLKMTSSPLVAPRPSKSAPAFSSARSARSSVVVRSTGWADPKATAGEKAMFGEDFGARDPFPGEIASNFGEKVLGHYNTDHVIKVPTSIKDHVGLTSRQCLPVAQLVLLDEKELNLLKQQVPGWRVVQGQSAQQHQAIRHEWRARSPEAATQIQAAITEVFTALGHAPQHLSVNGDMVVAELSTPSVMGLSENDFVLAARINELDLKPHLPAPRKRFWA